jgi:hypothetical protein
MNLTTAILTCALIFGSGTAFAALDSVSGPPVDPDNGPLTEVLSDGDPETIVPVQLSLANGFPIWYQDVPNGLKLELCLEQNPTLDPALGFCLTAAPSAGNPISFPLNFGPEALYWVAETDLAFISTPDPETGAARGGDALLVLALEAGFANEFISATDQTVFARIRIRLDVPVPGTYTVTHPFGSAIYEINAITGDREVNETQDIGDFLVPVDFTTALDDGPGLPELPAVDPPRISDSGASIGPFLTWLDFNPDLANPNLELVDAKGNRYLGKPGIEARAIKRFITGSPLDTNFFRVEFEPNEFTPAQDALDFANGTFFLVNEFLDDSVFPPVVVPGAPDGPPTNTILLEDFLVAGKIFNDGANIAPIARPEFGGGAPGTTVNVPVLANDTDPLLVGTNLFDATDPLNQNVHTVNPQGLSLDPTGGFQIRIVTPAGNSVARVISFADGVGSFSFTPAEGFTGVDSFQYVVQDTGGLTSLPTTVAVAVDDLTLSEAGFRPKLMKWSLSGAASLSELSAVDLATGDTMFFTPLAGIWNTPARQASTGSGRATVTVIRDPSSNLVTDLDFSLEVNGLTGITAAHIHAAPASGSAGSLAPIAVTLFDADGDLTTVGAELNPVSVDAPLVVEPTTRFPGIDPRNAVTVTDVDDPVNGPLPDLNAVVQAIIDGRAYVQVHTVANPPGEIRGQLGRNLVAAHAGADTNAPLIGVAPVELAGEQNAWRLPAKGKAALSTDRTISLQSSAGGLLTGQALKLR